MKDLFKCYNINDIKTVGIFIGAEVVLRRRDQLAKQEDITLWSGERIRTETAAVAALSIIMHEMENWHITNISSSNVFINVFRRRAFTTYKLPNW